MKTERGGERNWDPLQLQLFVILTQIQHWNMATMWTLSRSVAPGSARPIRGDVAVRGGGPWGGSGSRSLREREALKSVSQAEKTHLQESWTTRRPMETGWTLVLLSFVSCIRFTFDPQRWLLVWAAVTRWCHSVWMLCFGLNHEQQRASGCWADVQKCLEKTGFFTVLLLLKNSENKTASELFTWLSQTSWGDFCHVVWSCSDQSMKLN